MSKVARYADIAYKFLKGLASTSTERYFYEETRPFFPRVLPQQIWSQGGLIPSVAPGGNPGEVIGVVKRVVDLSLIQEPGVVNSFYHPELKDAIDPERFGVSYLFVIKNSLGQVIPAGTSNYEVNPDAGTLTFDDNYVPSNLPYSISFYKYVGEKGLSGGGSAGGTFETNFTNVSVLDITHLLNRRPVVRVYDVDGHEAICQVVIDQADPLNKLQITFNQAISGYLICS